MHKTMITLAMGTTEYRSARVGRDLHDLNHGEPAPATCQTAPLPATDFLSFQAIHMNSRCIELDRKG